ncbi:nuclease A inhibitor family protein [Adhaeribacter arboris]|uniref:nuclease A inhibitor family protein n=1 Tax=Adhaeribacter arboris TaxID=2072846 RepID=UPI001304DED0|nr:nuclease A inhibitor family protein [Adhaeribacter arboris]
MRNHLPPLTKLLTILHQSPVNIQVYQIHQLSEETYVIGQEEEGNFAGLKTELAVV